MTASLAATGGGVAQATHQCLTYGGTGACVTHDDTIGGGTSIPITWEQEELCYLIDCLENGETIATIPAPIPTVPVPGVQLVGVGVPNYINDRYVDCIVGSLTYVPDTSPPKHVTDHAEWLTGGMLDWCRYYAENPWG